MSNFSLISGPTKQTKDQKVNNNIGRFPLYLHIPIKLLILLFQRLGNTICVVPQPSPLQLISRLTAKSVHAIGIDYLCTIQNTWKFGIDYDPTRSPIVI